MLPIFAIAMFISAALLFAVQPIVGKMVLPRLGGSPAVWNTCMVFFQALLLLGYTYAHLLTKYFSIRIQMAIHALLLLAAALTLPIALPHLLPARFDFSTLPAGDTLSIISWLILVLGLTAGAPFLVLSATAPLLQSWFAKTSHSQARDPYFLYAASNAGSILGLVSYPTMIEPLLGITDQGKYWGAAYVALLICLVIAAACAVRNLAPVAVASAPVPAISPDSAPTRRTRLRWIALAAVPSSVSLGVTQYISTDIAAVPLLWVIPLLLYLLSFVFAFSRRGVNVKLWSWVLAASGVAAAALIIAELRTPIVLVLSIHLLVLFAAAMTCHGQLANERPAPRYLTEYYLLMSLGGMIGGIFNAIIAPLIFPIVFEYQLAIVAAVFLRPAPVLDPAPHRPRFVTDALAITGVLALLLVGTVIIEKYRPPEIWVVRGILYGIPCTACALLLLRGGHRRFALGLLLILIYAPIYSYFGSEHVIHTERTFFGVHRVVTHKDDTFRTLFHGRTIHGVEARYLLPNIRPATYYHPTGPVGQVLTEDALGDRLNSIAVIGLGAGSLALYNEDNCAMDFFEIDPAVVRIANNPAYFDYLSPKFVRGKIRIALGDGRLEIEKMPDNSYGIIVLDAFSSDAIPTHLLTREAIALYRRKLRPNGLLVIHISNIYFDLQPVVAALAADARLTARVRHDRATPLEQSKEAKSDSMWCVLSAQDADLGPIAADPRWKRILPGPAAPLWTDDYSNVLKVLNW